METSSGGRRQSLIVNFGGKIGSMKRHSLANIAEAWKGYSLGRRGSLGGCRMSVANALDCASRHEFLESIQVAVIQLFQKKKLQEFELASLQENVRNLVETEAGPLIFDYFKEKLLKKGMVILRECMKNDLGMVLLKKMSDQWNYLYTQILPLLQAMLYPLAQNKDTSIKKVTMLEFRDVVVLKVGLDDSLSTVAKEDIPTSITQMLLVLQGYHDGYPPSENYAKLERMVARVVSPHLGFFGYYEGSPVPTVPCSIKPSSSPKHKEKTEAYELDAVTAKNKLRHSNFLSVRHVHRHGNGHIFNSFLEPVSEHENVRRHSIDM